MRVGVLLSGCGVQDGSEIYESVLTLLALERNGAAAVVMAPDVEQAHVVNHYSGGESRLERRDVLAEAARIVRGKIVAVTEISAHDLDALIIPGGYGVTKNLCTYAENGVQGKVNRAVERLIDELHGLGKPIGAMCLAPILLAMALPGRDLSLTMGNDVESVRNLQQLNARAVNSTVDEIHIDPKNHIVSTAAFMLAQTPGEAEPAINALVARVLDMARVNTNIGVAPATSTASLTADMPVHD